MVSKAVFGVAATMSDLHALDIAHRDLTPEHVVVNENGESFIIDFARAIFCKNPIASLDRAGMHPFLAPEVIAGRGRQASDMYSFAVLLYQIFSAELPFEGVSFTPSASSSLITYGDRPDRVAGIPEAFWELITACWNQDSNERPFFSAITEMMLESDDLTLRGTDIEDYQAYQDWMMSGEMKVWRGNTQEVLKLIESAGVTIDDIPGLPP
jgi:serine/threonine protein kinase